MKNAFDAAFYDDDKKRFREMLSGDGFWIMDAVSSFAKTGNLPQLRLFFESDIVGNVSLADHGIDDVELLAHALQITKTAADKSKAKEFVNAWTAKLGVIDVAAATEALSKRQDTDVIKGLLSLGANPNARLADGALDNGTPIGVMMAKQLPTAVCDMIGHLLLHQGSSSQGSPALPLTQVMKNGKSSSIFRFCLQVKGANLAAERVLLFLRNVQEGLPASWQADAGKQLLDYLNKNSLEINKDKTAIEFGVMSLAKLDCAEDWLKIIDSYPQKTDFASILVGNISSQIAGLLVLKNMMRDGVHPDRIPAVLARHDGVGTALHLAVESLNADAVKVLLEAGADPFLCLENTVTDCFAISAGADARLNETEITRLLASWRARQTINEVMKQMNQSKHATTKGATS